MKLGIKKSLYFEIKENELLKVLKHFLTYEILRNLLEIFKSFF